MDKKPKGAGTSLRTSTYTNGRGLTSTHRVDSVLYMTDMPELLTTAAVAEHLGVTVKTVRKWIREGKLDAIRISDKTTRISQGQLQRFLERNTTHDAT